MTTHDALLPATVLQRKAVVYVRQSTPQQVQSNLESQRPQYESLTRVKGAPYSAAPVASRCGWRPGLGRSPGAPVHSIRCRAYG
jgi:hypothetical protein